MSTMRYQAHYRGIKYEVWHGPSNIYAWTVYLNGVERSGVGRDERDAIRSCKGQINLFYLDNPSLAVDEAPPESVAPLYRLLRGLAFAFVTLLLLALLEGLAIGWIWSPVENPAVKFAMMITPLLVGFPFQYAFEANRMAAAGERDQVTELKMTKETVFGVTKTDTMEYSASMKHAAKHLFLAYALISAAFFVTIHTGWALPLASLAASVWRH